MNYWRKHGRHDLPWRLNINPYRVLVSEIMLQQTQVDRVIPFYKKFLRVFPSFRALAQAAPAKVLRAWQGLGYNRRALMLQRCAQTVMATHGGRLPSDYEQLKTLPGIGPYTAGAIIAFAFNKSVPVIETNIRRVYLHHFFPNHRNVPDTKILRLVTCHLPLISSPRNWFSALMDYGTYLAETISNPNRRSRHYAKQSKFEGSVRQLRGQVLRLVTQGEGVRVKRLERQIPDKRLPGILMSLEREGFIRRTGGILKA